MLIYIDSSVMARAYLSDEVGHADVRLIDGPDFLVTSTLTIIEVTAALVRATNAGRVADGHVLLRKLDAEIGPEGPVTTIGSEQSLVENAALNIVRTFGLRALDALHLAVADLTARRLAGDDETVAFAARDDGQRAVAEELGFVTV